MRLRGTFLNKKQNHTCVDVVNSAYLIDEIIWKDGGNDVKCKLCY